MSVILDIEEGGWVGTFDMTGSKSKIADPDSALTWIQRGGGRVGIPFFRARKTLRTLRRTFMTPVWARTRQGHHTVNNFRGNNSEHKTSFIRSQQKLVLSVSSYSKCHNRHFL